jgi:transposase
MVCEFARSPMGERAHALKSTNRGTRISTIGALNFQGLAAELGFEGTLNTLIFNYFIEKHLAPKLQAGNVVILDNVSAHNPDDLREILTPLGVSVMFLPPYSPELNPIEKIWYQIKIYLKKHTAEDQEQLYQRIFEAIQQITPLSAYNCLQDCLLESGV